MIDPHFRNTPHRRYNPLTGEWVLVSPHRLSRPWQGKIEAVQPDRRPSYDPQCYLCPGNGRAGGAQNPNYQSTFVFENDFAALLEKNAERAPSPSASTHELLRAEPEWGVCRVICFSPRHDLTLAQMNGSEIGPVVDAWCAEYQQLAARGDIGYVQIFENKGQLMGCSNPHPHGQIWATAHVPFEPAREDEMQRKYDNRHGRPLLQDYLAEELREGERIVCQNGTWVALVPFWAIWPFEVIVLPVRQVSHLGELTDDEKNGLAEILGRMTARYDNLFGVSFPYTMGIHQAPTTSGRHGHWTMHLHFFPPLLRSATIQKFMVGFEMLGMPQRDLTAEYAAERLRSCPEVHYLQRSSTSDGAN